MNRSAAPRTTALRHALLTLLLTGAAHATSFSVGGEIRNPAATRALGSGDLRVLMTNLSGGWLLGMGPLNGTRFNVVVPVTFRPPVQPLDVCPGVKVTPAGARTYTAETLLVFNAATNTVATLVQADAHTDPTERGQWIYSDRAVTLRGRCAGLNTYYALTLRPGWTGVTTESANGRFEIRNARRNLPYWVQPVLSTAARQTFPTLFSGERSAFNR